MGLVASQEEQIKSRKQMNNTDSTKKIQVQSNNIKRRIGFGRPTEGVKERLGAYGTCGERSSLHVNLKGRIGGKVDRSRDDLKGKSTKSRLGVRDCSGVAVRTESGIKIITFSDEEDKMDEDDDDYEPIPDDLVLTEITDHGPQPAKKIRKC